jgi:GT2 family glycosyltransferase
MIGVAILCYEGHKDLVRSLDAVKLHTSVPGEEIEIIVFDNSERTKQIRKHVEKKHPDVIYQTEGKNTGCTRSRNIVFNTFVERHPDAKYLVILDQDIEVQPDWLSDMWRVAGQHKDCGVVAWPQAYRLKHRPIDGVVSEVASMCNLHVIEPLKQVKEKWGGPFDERFFFHKFDSLICQRLNQLGFRTRLAMNYYKNNLRWEKQKGGIVHHHPHQGVRRHPECAQIIRAAKRLFAKLQRSEGWTLWYPGGAKVVVTARKKNLANEIARQRKASAPTVHGVPRMVHGQRPTSPLPIAAPPKPPRTKPRKTLRQLLRERHGR